MHPPHTTRLHAAIVKANWQFAVGDSKQFRPRVFWANAGIITRFPMRLPARTSQGWLRRPTASVSSAPPARSSLISASHCRWGSLRLTLLATGGCSWQRRFLPSTRPRRRPAAEEKDTEMRGQKDTRFLSGGRRAHSHVHLLAASRMAVLVCWLSTSTSEMLRCLLTWLVYFAL